MSKSIMADQRGSSNRRERLFRFSQRELAWISIVIVAIAITAVTTLWISGAWATEKQAKFLNQKPEQYLRAKPAITTTTTTTTTAPKPRIVKQTAPAPAIPEYLGTPQDWMREAGIPESDWLQAELLVSREGGWRPCVHNGGVIDCNYSGSKAYGIPQSLPGSKMASEGADWRTNPVTQLRWMKKYVEGRYGTWLNANLKWESRSPHWY